MSLLCKSHLFFLIDGLLYLRMVTVYAMNKRVCSILFCALFSLLSYAQDSLRIVKSELKAEDIYAAFEAMDVWLYRFDLSRFQHETYQVVIYIDEYVKGKEPKRVRTLPFGKNVRSLEEISADYRDGWRKMKQIPEGEDSWIEIKELSTCLTRPADSIVCFNLQVPDATKTRHKLKLHPISSDGFTAYYYRPRPFKLENVKAGGDMEIPLLLYGSAWRDEEYGVIRFCGEKEIDFGMKAKILEHLPHYYVMGIRLYK